MKDWINKPMAKKKLSFMGKIGLTIGVALGVGALSYFGLKEEVIKEVCSKYYEPVETPLIPYTP